MQNYFFHLRRLESYEKEVDGIAFSDLDAAILDAKIGLREMARDALITGEEPDIVAIDIADVDGTILASVTTDDDAVHP